MITSGSYSFNAAHCAAYGVLGVWTMYFKQHYPDVFYAGSMKYYADEKQLTLIRDAERPRPGAPREPVKVLPPSYKNPIANWEPASRNGNLRIQAGMTQVGGIGAKMAPAIIEHGPYNSWDELIRVPRIGPKKIATIKEFVGREDPFDVYTLENSIMRTKDALARKELQDPRTGRALPQPTYTSVEQQEEGAGKHLKVVWLGTVNHRNPRDYFEVNQARGTEVNRDTVKDPHLREFCLLRCEDESDVIHLKIDRRTWPIYRDAILRMDLGKDLLLVEGYRPKGAYTLKVQKLWVVDPEDENDTG
jgi:hypothetical protein